MNQPIGPGASRRNRHHLNIPRYRILTLVTLFICNLYRNYRRMVTCNELLGRSGFSGWTWARSSAGCPDVRFAPGRAFRAPAVGWGTR